MIREIDVVLVTSDYCRHIVGREDDEREMDIYNQYLLSKEGSGIWWMYEDIIPEYGVGKLSYITIEDEQETLSDFGFDNREDIINWLKSDKGTNFIELDKTLQELTMNGVREIIKEKYGFMDGIDGPNTRKPFPKGREIPSVETSVARRIDLDTLWIKDAVKEDTETVIISLNQIDEEICTVHHYEDIIFCRDEDERNKLIHKGITSFNDLL